MSPWVLIALAVRLPFLIFPGHGWDRWAEIVLQVGTWRFYDQTPDGVPLDHLPGDLVILHLMAWPTSLLTGGDLTSGGIPALIYKLAPIASDLAIVVMTVLLARQYLEPAPGRWLVWSIILNPALILDGVIWGQWDAFPLALTLGAIMLVVRGQLGWAAVALAWAVLSKPMMAVVALPIAIYLLRSRPTWLRDLARMALAALATFYALCLPYRVTLTGIGESHSIWERLAVSFKEYDITSLGANNLWHSHWPFGQGVRISREVWPGVTAETLGLALMVALTVIIGIYAAVHPQRETGLWMGAALIQLASFMVMTRMHDRYLLPGAVLALIATALTEPRLRWFGVVITLGSAMNSAMSLFETPGGGTRGLALPGWLTNHAADRFFAEINLAAFVIGLALAIWYARHAAAVASPG